MSKAIGGYFGYEPGGVSGVNPHSGRHAVNTGRNALQCILEMLKPVKLLVPFLTCDAVLEPVRKLSIPFEFYSVLDNLHPAVKTIEKNTFLICINYFGVCDRMVKEMASTFPGQLIVDNTQAFFSGQIHGIPSFWSARKFFGVPDGAYFSGTDYSTCKLPLDSSEQRLSHLLKRRDISPEAGYTDFLENEKVLREVPPARMSVLTRGILNSVDFRNAASRREDNYRYLHSNLQNTNQLSGILPNSSPAISYPYLPALGCDFRRILREKRIYVPLFWPETSKRAAEGSIEKTISDSTLHLPIDQRYDRNDMDVILNTLSDLSQQQQQPL